MRLPHLDVGLVFRRVVAGHRGLVVGKLDHDIARATLSFNAVELAAAHDETAAEFLEDRGIGRHVRLVAFIVVNVDASDPEAFCHLVFLLLQTSDCLISVWMASAAALGSAASTIGRPTTR